MTYLTVNITFNYNTKMSILILKLFQFLASGAILAIVVTVHIYTSKQEHLVWCISDNRKLNYLLYRLVVDL